MKKLVLIFIILTLNLTAAESWKNEKYLWEKKFDNLGAVEFITCVKEIQDGFIHKTVGYETPDEEIDLNYCKDSYEEPVEYALSNSLGFGGHNASILLKAYK